MTPSLAELGRALDVAEAIVEITDEGFDEFDAARTAYIDALHAEYVRKQSRRHYCRPRRAVEVEVERIFKRAARS